MLGVRDKLPQRFGRISVAQNLSVLNLDHSDLVQKVSVQRREQAFSEFVLRSLEHDFMVNDGLKLVGFSSKVAESFEYRFCGLFGVLGQSGDFRSCYGEALKGCEVLKGGRNIKVSRG